MRRIPAIVLVLAPLAAAALYAALWPLFAPMPALLSVVPEEAILTHRFRNREMFDAAFFRSPSDPVLPSEREAARRNLPGLPGIDPRRPFHLVFLPRTGRPNPTMLILPVADAALVRQRFEDPSWFLDRGFVRYAQYLGIRGEFAAIGRDRDAVQRLGGGGLTAPVLGEDHVLAVRVPEMVIFALSAPRDPLWGPILRALGFEAGERREMSEGVEVPAGRVGRVYGSWRTARLWSWLEPGRIRLELEPAPGPLAEGLAAFVRAGGARGWADRSPTPPPEAQAYLRLEGPEARVVMALALFAAGLEFPAALADATGPLGALGRIEEGDTGGLLLWTVASPGFGRAWTIGLAAPRGSLPDLTPFHPALRPAEPGVGTSVAEGALPLTIADLKDHRPSPAARVVRHRTPDLDVVLAGTAPDEAWAGFLAHRGRGEEAEGPEGPAPGWRPLAQFGLIELRARSILGAELETGGLLRALSGGGIEGTVSTDGRTLRLDAHVRRP